jgi:hypothetical protein
MSLKDPEKSFDKNPKPIPDLKKNPLCKHEIECKFLYKEHILGDPNLITSIILSPKNKGTRK